LLSIWSKVLLIYLKLKETPSKIDFMATVLANELPQKLELFFDLEILSDLNLLY
jgi:hypothetical protein